MAAQFRRSVHYCGIALFALVWVMAAFLLPSGRAAATPFAAVVMDARSGEILHSVNDQTRLHPASLTKMMTLYIAFEAVQNGEISLDTQVTVSRRAASEVPSRLGLRAGQRIAFRHLIRGAALRSGNDAATAIAEAVSGSVEAFAQRMNRTAVAIGMNQTTFRNAHGLTQAGHLSTARDMTILGRQIYFDYPQYYNLFSRRSEDAGVAHIRNTNWRFLDSYRGADGIKTGFTRAAGYNLTASAERGGKRIIVTVFGARSTVDRHQRIVELMDRGFRQAPAQVAVRRPARPDYSRPQPVAVASTSNSTGQAAARVVRTQTAPSRSPLPERRPDPAATEVPEALIASLQSSVTQALAAASEPEGPEVESAVQMALAAAPESSLAPAPRPGDPDVDDPAETLAPASGPEVEVARSAGEDAGFAVIDADTFAAITETTGATPTDDLAAEEMLLEDLLTAEAEPAAEAAPLSALAAAGPEPRPASLLDADSPESAEDLLAEGAEILLTDATSEAALDPAPTDPLAQASLAAVLPAEPAGALPEELAAAQILWRDEAPLAEVASRAATAVEGLILLTTSEGDADEAPRLAGRSALPEVLTRVSTSGGRVWSIDLGLHPSRFDAERVAIRAALAETAILSTGLRRVSPRAGRFAAGIYSLTEDEAEIACLRLSARGHACQVVHP